MKIKRFTRLQRLFHLMLILTFLTQGWTGLGRLYIETDWGRFLVSVFGGYQSCLTAHKVVGIIMLLGFSLHVIYLITKFPWIGWMSWMSVLLGPESIIPNFQDVKDFIQHVKWFFGLAPAPAFERWGYWEKFDYWAVFWGIPVLGATGLLLAWPTLTSLILPGWTLNVAIWIHRIEAMLAMMHVFIIHFFIGHLRRHNFPMDLAMFEGAVDLNKMRHEKPAWVARVELSGGVARVAAAETRPYARAVYYIFGFLAMACGLFLLIGGLINGFRITWT